MKQFYILNTLLIFILISCSNDEVVSNCGEHGIPVTGTDDCFCELFYEGEFCEIEIREKFIGEWTGYFYRCAWGDSIPDGFKVEIIKSDDVTEVEIRSNNIFNNDTILVKMDFLGYIRYTENQIVGNQIIPAYTFDIYHNREEPEELSVYIDRNEDLDEWSEFCGFTLKRE